MNQVSLSLTNTKLYSQTFACLVFNKHNQYVDSEIVKIRRKKLRIWFSTRSIPIKEKSYISQLINGKASFGEKAAERLEKTYGMGYKYLDTDSDDEELLLNNKATSSPILDLSSLPLEKEIFMREMFEKIKAQNEEEFRANVGLYNAAENVAKVEGKSINKKSRKKEKSE